MKAIVNKKAAARIHQGHPWIFKDDIINLDKAQPGLCYVYSEHKQFLASAFYSSESKLALRVLEREQIEIDADFFMKKLEQAQQFRKRLYPKEKCYRVVFAESDALPSIIIDRYENLIAFQTLSEGAEAYKDLLIQCIQKIFEPTSIVERNDSTIRNKEKLPLIKQFVYGEAPEEVEVKINNSQFTIQPLEGQKTGWFLDQKENAHFLKKFASGRVLDICSYQGQFSINLAPYCKELYSVDISESAIEQLKKQAELNEIENIQAIKANAFDYLKELDRSTNQDFDLIVLDPPAFVKSKRKLEEAARGYKELNLRAMKLLKPGGFLATFSCSQHFKDELMRKTLSRAARDAKRQVQYISYLGQAPDHPILISAPETEYFKGYLLRVL